MAAPGGFDMEAFRIMLQAECDRLFEKMDQKFGQVINKIDQNIAELKEDNKSIKSEIAEVNNKLEQQSERLDQKLEQRSENFKQATIKITEGLQDVKQVTRKIMESIQEIKKGKAEIKRSIIDGNQQLTEKLNETNLRIDKLENTCKLALQEQAMKCENTHKKVRLECRENINELHETINKQLIINTSKQDEKIQSAIDRLENKIDMVTSKIKYTNKYENVYKLMSYQSLYDIQSLYNVKMCSTQTQDARNKRNTSLKTRVNYHTKYKTRTCEFKQKCDNYSRKYKREIILKHTKYKRFETMQSVSHGIRYKETCDVGDAERMSCGRDRERDGESVKQTSIRERSEREGLWRETERDMQASTQPFSRRSRKLKNRMWQFYSIRYVPV
jgi:hypothetical protein